VGATLLKDYTMQV